MRGRRRGGGVGVRWSGWVGRGEVMGVVVLLLVGMCVASNTQDALCKLDEWYGGWGWRRWDLVVLVILWGYGNDLRGLNCEGCALCLLLCMRWVLLLVLLLILK